MDLRRLEEKETGPMQDLEEEQGLSEGFYCRKFSLSVQMLSKRKRLNSECALNVNINNGSSCHPRGFPIQELRTPGQTDALRSRDSRDCELLIASLLLAPLASFATKNFHVDEKFRSQNDSWLRKNPDDGSVIGTWLAQTSFWHGSRFHAQPISTRSGNPQPSLGARPQLRSSILAMQRSSSEDILHIYPWNRLKAIGHTNLNIKVKFIFETVDVLCQVEVITDYSEQPCKGRDCQEMFLIH